MSLAVLADHMASKGRGPDSMLIHMSPREVQGLQALAQSHGGSLTVNPHTGLPEAGFLDKLLPTIIGAGLSMIPGVGPMMAAGIVGGIQTVRTGDIGKGLAAGLGAYGGAGLAQGLSTAGANALSGEATSIAAADAAKLAGEEAVRSGIAQGFTPEMLEAAKMEAIDTAGSNTARVATDATPWEKLSTGAKTAATNPMQYLKANAMPLAMATGPAILAGANVQNKLPQTVTKPGVIRPYTFDPYGGGYVSANPYEAAPTRAAEGGLMGMADGGYSPGMLDFTQKSEPVVRMAEGGVAGYAVGGAPAMLSDEELYQQTGSWEAAAAARDAQNNALNQYNWSQQAAAPVVSAAPQAPEAQGLAALAQPTYNQYTNEQIGQYLTTNPNVDLATAIKTTNADPAAVNAYLASLDNPFKGSTDTERGSGTLGIYNQMKAQGIDPNELYAANVAVDPKYAGWSASDITKGYNLDKGAYALSEQLKGTVSDKDWAKFMDDNGYSVNDMAQAFGLSRQEVQARYAAAKQKEKEITKYVTIPSGGGGGGTTIPTYTRDGTGTGGSLETVTGLPPGVSGAGITTVNPNGTITTRPNIPGIPEGGFTGMADVRGAYTKGGGSLGFTPYVPTSIEDFNTKYGTQTGGTKAALDYLTGKSPYPIKPSTPTGEVIKPYAESVLGMPANLSKKMYLFDPATQQYKINPDYAIPTYDAKGNKVYNVTNKDVIAQMAAKPSAADFYAWAKANNLTVEQIAAATGMPITEVQKMFTGGAPKDETATATGSVNDTRESGGAKAGGLMAMAGGGATNYNLGDYSDGGRLLRGPGDGVSDSIPASIGNKRPARLADGEFVVPARIVSELGNGSTEAGARKLYAMMDRVQAARRGTVGKGKVAKNSRADKNLPA